MCVLAIISFKFVSWSIFNELYFNSFGFRAKLSRRFNSDYPNWNLILNSGALLSNEIKSRLSYSPMWHPAPYTSEAICKVITASDWPAIDQRFHNSGFFGFNQLAGFIDSSNCWVRLIEFTGIFLTGLVYYKVCSETVRWKRPDRAEHGKGHGTSCSPPPFPAPPCVHQPGCFHNPVLLCFLQRLHYMGRIDYMSLAVDSTFSPSPPP